MSKIRFTIKSESLSVLHDHLKYTENIQDRKKLWHQIEKYLFTGECDVKVPNGVKKIISPLVDTFSDADEVLVSDQGLMLYREDVVCESK